MSEEVKYPEHEKMTALGERRATVQEFIDWLLDESPMKLVEECEVDVGRPPCVRMQKMDLPTRMTREQIMAAFFQIDLKKISVEKDQMYQEILRDNKRREAECASS